MRVRPSHLPSHAHLHSHFAINSCSKTRDARVFDSNETERPESLVTSVILGNVYFAVSGAMTTVVQKARHRCKGIWSRVNDPADVAAARWVVAAVLCADAISCVLIIAAVPYTEIDWVAYMQQVQTFLQGERDYALIKGQTGPLVYPAGFLYTFTALFYATAGGNIQMAQWLFAAAYLVNQYVVMRVYIATRAVPPWTLLLLCLSKRVHSIFLLRLFNDGITMLLANVAMLLLVQRRWRLSLLLFSAALSVKMSVLLLAPPVAIILLQAADWKEIGIGTAAAAVLQLTIGVPFLLHQPTSYITKAFEFSRKFLYQWSVNWRFVPESIFLSGSFATALLVAHLGLLLLFSHCKWCRSAGGLLKLTLHRLKGKSIVLPLSAKHMVMALFSGNLIGVVCARTLHFQFYSWYFHMLPFLLWQINMRTTFRILLLLCVECVWNVFPTTTIASAALFSCHCVLLIGMWQTPSWQSEQQNVKQI